MKRRRCTASLRNFMPMPCVRELVNWTAEKVLLTRRSSASSHHGLQNNLVAARTGRFKGSRSLYSPRQSRRSTTLRGKTHREGGESFNLAGTRPGDCQVWRSNDSRSFPRSISARPPDLPQTAEPVDRSDPARTRHRRSAHPSVIYFIYDNP